MSSNNYGNNFGTYHLFHFSINVDTGKIIANPTMEINVVLLNRL